MPTDTESFVPERRTKSCPYCSEQILITASKCKHCGEWLQQRRTVAAGMVTSHSPIRVVPASTTVILTIVTLGIYQVFWLWRVFSDLHARGSTETSPGKAVGFLFIPFYNFVWVFLVWKEFGEAVVREHRSAGAHAPSTGVTMLAPIGTIAGLVLNLAAPGAGSVIALILLPISIGNGQSWLNQLAVVPIGHPGGASGSNVATKSCPTCGEQIPIEARLCRFCQHTFSDSEVAEMTQQRNQEAEAFVRDQHRQRLKSREKVCRIWGWVLVALAGLFLVSSFAQLLSGPKGNTGLAEHILGFVAATIIVCGLPAGFGYLLLRKATTARNELQHLQ